MEAVAPFGTPLQSIISSSGRDVTGNPGAVGLHSKVVGIRMMVSLPFSRVAFDGKRLAVGATLDYEVTLPEPVAFTRSGAECHRDRIERDFSDQTLVRISDETGDWLGRRERPIWRTRGRRRRVELAGGGIGLVDVQPAAEIRITGRAGWVGLNLPRVRPVRGLLGHGCARGHSCRRKEGECDVLA